VLGAVGDVASIFVVWMSRMCVLFVPESVWCAYGHDGFA
jgi:hypothetical protein